MPFSRRLLPLVPALAVLAAAAGESTPYLSPVAAGVTVQEILTVGESGAAGPMMAGIPDGLGAFDNHDGTFTLLMNHEMGATVGAVRAHGNKGAFVSRWVINKATLAVVSIQDHNQSFASVKKWTGTTGAPAWTAGTSTADTAAFNRFCSADLPAVSAFYNAATGKGTQNRIFMTGEESGAEGRGFGHVVSGPDSGTSWELPHLGNFSYENAVACPYAQDTTIVISLDDSTPGQVYVYVGAKNSTGTTDVEKAGLVGGALYGIRANGVVKESRALNVGIPAKGGSMPFTLVPLGDVSGLTGAQLQTASVDNGVTEFLRPEDGAWDPLHPGDFYFVTTDQFDSFKNGGAASGANTGRSRLWRLRFADIGDPAAGGTITMLLDGTENHQMLDNLGIDRQGRILLQEDPGGQDHAARIWAYEIGTGALTELAKHEPTLFGNRVAGATTAPLAGFTNDEESSGIIDVADILGAGTFLAVVQAHGATKYSNGTDVPALAETVENGQLVLLTYPLAANHAPTTGPVTATTAQATALTIPASTVLAAVTDAENDAVAVTGASITSGDTGGTVKVVGDKIVYTPTAGFTGSTVITYTVMDGVRLSQPIPRSAMLTHTNGVVVYDSGFGSDIFPVAGTSDQFWLIADRGANADGTNPVPASSFQKLFPNPAYSPTLTKVRWNADGSVSVLATINLKDDSGSPVALTGIPNPKDAGFQTDAHMEVASTIFGGAIAGDPKGIDSESVALDSAGNFWVSDEYGPWLVKFDPTGKTLERVGPYAANTAGHKIPSVFARRTPGRGMESMTITPDGTKLVGLMQSGLMTGTDATKKVDTEAKGKKVAAARILVYTIATGACEEYVYILDDETTAFKRMVACSISTLDGITFTVLERDGDFAVGATNGFGKKKIFSFTLVGATNVTDDTAADGNAVDSIHGKLFGGLTVEEISGQVGTAATDLAAAGIVPVTKTLVKDLTPLCDAYLHDKWEGVVARSDGRLVLVNDDDFGIGGTDTLAAKIAPNATSVDANQLMEVDPAKMATATGTITVTVTAAVPANTAPTITNALDQSTNEDVAATGIGFVVGDAQSAATALVTTATSSNTTLVPDTSLVISGTGSARTLAATPAANQHGTTTVTVTVSDGTLSASDTFVLTVTAVNDAPVAANGTATVAAGAAVNGSVAATDAEGSPLTYAKVANPTQGTATVNANGTYTYTANAGATGTDTFTFKANDGTTDSNTATVTVTITAPAGAGAGAGSSSSSGGCGLGSGVAAFAFALLAALRQLLVRRRP